MVLIGVHRESWRTYMPPWPRKEEFLEVQLDTSVKGPWQRASSAHFSESVKKGWAPMAQFTWSVNFMKIIYFPTICGCIYISMSFMFSAASWRLCQVQLNSTDFRWAKNFCQTLFWSFLEQSLVCSAKGQFWSLSGPCYQLQHWQEYAALDDVNSRVQSFRPSFPYGLSSLLSTMVFFIIIIFSFLYEYTNVIWCNTMC